MANIGTRSKQPESIRRRRSREADQIIRAARGLVALFGRAPRRMGAAFEHEPTLTAMLACIAEQLAGVYDSGDRAAASTRLLAALEKEKRDERRYVARIAPAANKAYTHRLLGALERREPERLAAGSGRAPSRS